MTSRTAYRTRYRCGVTSCRARFTWKNRYKREPKCPECGDTIRVRNIEAERRRELAAQTRCYCNTYPFPHREGSLRMCVAHPLFNVVDPTPEEMESYERVCNTPRAM